MDVSLHRRLQSWLTGILALGMLFTGASLAQAASRSSDDTPGSGNPTSDNVPPPTFCCPVPTVASNGVTFCSPFANTVSPTALHFCHPNNGPKCLQASLQNSISLPTLLTPLSFQAFGVDNPIAFDWTDSHFLCPVSSSIHLIKYHFQIIAGQYPNPFSSQTILFDAFTFTSNFDFTGHLPGGLYYWRVGVASVDPTSTALSPSTEVWTAKRPFVIDECGPTLPTHLWPADGSIMTTAALTHLDWTDSFDQCPFPVPAATMISPVTYRYESAHDPSTNEDGSFMNPVYVSGILATSDIPSPGTPEGIYYWHVQAFDQFSNGSGWTEPWLVTVDNTPPGPVTLLIPSDGSTLGNESITQGWDGVDGAVLYEYQSCAVDPGDENGDCPDVVHTEQTPDTSRTIDPGQPDTHIWWRVRAQDGAGNWGPWSESFELIIDTTAPTIGLDPLSSPTFDTNVTLTGSWSDTGGSGGDYLEARLVRDADSSVVSDWTTYSTTEGNFSVPMSGLTPDTYRFEVRAFDHVNNQSTTAVATVEVMSEGEPSPTPSPSPEPTPTPSPSPSPEGTPTATPTPTTTPTPTPTPSPSQSPNGTGGNGGNQGNGGGIILAQATATPTPTPSPTITPSPSPTVNADLPASDATPAVKGASSDSGSGQPWYVWLWLLIPLALLLLLFFLFRRRDDEEQNY